MKPKRRRAEITDLIRQQGRVSVEFLSAQFDASVETIRRDLRLLSSAGKLQRTHGGAMLPPVIGEDTFQHRMGENVSAKRDIAKKASELVSPGDTILIDAGSTTLMLAEELTHIDELIVISNSTQIARILGAHDSTRVFLIGGIYTPESSANFGQMALEQLPRFRADYAFITVGGVAADAGVMDYDLHESELARGMIAQSEKVVVLADSTKFNRVAPFKVAEFSRMDYLVSEVAPDSDLAQRMLDDEVRLIY